jgi:hypothetical protein
MPAQSKNPFEGAKEKQALLFVNKKKQKNFVPRAMAPASPRPRETKVFCCFFSKKQCLPPFLSRRLQRRLRRHPSLLRQRGLPLDRRDPLVDVR